MNRKTAIRHIIAEAIGKPILSHEDDYEYSNIKEIASPIIRQMRGKINEGQQKLPTMKSIALKIQSGKLGRESLEDVKRIWLNLNHIMTQLFELRNDLHSSLKEAIEERLVSYEVSRAIISDLYRYISGAQALTRRQYKYCCGESVENIFEDIETMENYLSKADDTLYVITKGMLH